MLTLDVEDIEPWIPRVIQSLEIWKDIVSNSKELLMQLFDCKPPHLHCMHHLERLSRYESFHDSPMASVPSKSKHNLEDPELYRAILFKSHRRTVKQREALRCFLEPRLAYVNANILLARRFGATLYDWNDFSPFYQRKFGLIGQDLPHAEDEKSQLSLLFSFIFPSQFVENYDHFFKAVRDKRTAELRQLCEEAALGIVQFDNEFAASVWREQLGWSEAQRRFSRRISWWTLPANAIPYLGSALAFGGQKLAEGLYERIEKEPHPWLFLFLDVIQLNRPETK